MDIKTKGLKEILEEDALLKEKITPDEVAKILAKNEEDASLEDAYRTYQLILNV